MTTANQKPYMTVREIATHFGVNQGTVRGAILRSGVEYRTLSKAKTAKWFVRIEDVPRVEDHMFEVNNLGDRSRPASSAPPVSADSGGVYRR